MGEDPLLLFPGEMLRLAFGVGFFCGAIVAGMATWVVFA